jgi:hypothetical protein
VAVHEPEVLMRVPTALLLLVTLILAPAAARGDDKKYTIDDLQALVKNGAWDEASQHLEDIPPAKRDPVWRGIVEKVAIAQLKALDLDKSPLEGLVLADAYTKRFSFLVKSKPFMTTRADVGMKGFERCFGDEWSRQTCVDRLLPFVEVDRGNVALALKAAGMQMRAAVAHASAPLWLLAVEWGKASKKVCTAERLDESIMAALALPRDYKQLDSGLKVADRCFPYFKERLQEVVLEDGYLKTNICPLLKRKNAVPPGRCVSK